MIRLLLAAVFACTLVSPSVALDPRCDGAGRYWAMWEGDRSGRGVAHACALPVVESAVQSEICTASQYGVGDGYHGKRTASGSIFNTWAANPYTVAHLTRRFGSWVTVTNLANGRSIRAKVTDRGPYYHGRCVDLGRAGANAIGMGSTARVRVEATTSIAP